MHRGTRALAGAVVAAGLGIAGPLAAQTSADSAAPAAQARSAAPVETRYTLVQVAGRALPVETEKELRCRDEVTAGTLALRDDGRWRLETDTREICGDRTETDRDDEDGTYRTEGGTLRFLDEDGRENTSGWSLDRELDLDELAAGTLGDGGTLSVRLADDNTVLLFRREAP